MRQSVFRFSKINTDLSLQQHDLLEALLHVIDVIRMIKIAR